MMRARRRITSSTRILVVGKIRLDHWLVRPIFLVAPFRRLRPGTIEAHQLHVREEMLAISSQNLSRVFER